MADPKQPVEKGAPAPKIATDTGGLASRPLREGAAAPKVSVDVSGVPTTQAPVSGVTPKQ